MRFGWTVSPISVVFSGFVILTGCVTTRGGEMKKPGEIALTAKDLYAGFDARKVVPDKEGKSLGLDVRVFEYKTSHKGWAVTDPIPLIPPADAIAPAGTVEGLEVEAQADIPDGASVMLEVRTGPRGLDEDGWSLWEKIQDLKGSVRKVTGRYAQVRLTFQATAEDKLPGVSLVTLRPKVKLATAWKKEPKVAENKIQKIVRSPIEFHYENPHHPKLTKLRKAAKLDEVIKDCKDDFEALVKLQDWVASSKNDRAKGWKKTKHYPWDIDTVLKVDGAKPEERVVFGHCMSYCEVFVDVCSALGYKARHTSIMGFREMSHEVPDAWVPSLGKWVFFDPSLANNYYDLETKKPLNILEIHKIIADTFLNEGETMAWFSTRKGKSYGQTKSRVKKRGGKKHIGAYLGGWMYGKPMPENYDWGWRHGWLAQGFVQMTPRNDFYTHPEAVSKRFGSYPGYSDYPFWVDEKTPPRRGVKNWYTRHRDFYWTLDQASVALVKGEKEGTLVVELGQSVPYFARYEIKIDGKDVTPKGAPPKTIEWKLNAGKNTLDVAPIDKFDKRGLASSVVVEY
jgi:hypothetical protein